jgi:serine protease AprX
VSPDRGFTWNDVISALGRHTPAIAAALRALRRTAAVMVAVLLAVANIGPVAATTPYDPATDGYSTAAIAHGLGADAWWDAGYTGAGVDVALIDSGVAPVAGLDSPGKVVYGPDLSFESQSPDMRNLDTFGHGTFMAGLIAGHDATLTAPYRGAPASAYRGIAPDARILSLKVATADGGTDVSQVIAAIDWIVQHRFDNGLNVRIINLSYGTNSIQSYMVDPLAFAVEQAWKQGIVVVAAAGNTGFQRGHNAPGLSDPGYDPSIIGVGSNDTLGTSTLADDRTSAFSASSSNGLAKAPDLLAPGSHVQGLRAANGYIDQGHPEGLLDGRYFRGSGTSQATAITSGAIALILQKYPNLTPDQVKRFIADNATKLGGSTSGVQGAGELDLAALLAATPPLLAAHYPFGTGTGSLELTRGSDHLTLDGVVLAGEQDIFGAHFDSAASAAAEAAGNTWSGGTWNGNTWSGNTWSGNTWSGNTWSGNTWSGNTWSGNTWSGNTWAGNTWWGNTWTGNTWTGIDWATDSWS